MSFQCKFEGCNYKSPWNSNLRRHEKCVHNTGVRYFKREIGDCD